MPAADTKEHMRKRSQLDDIEKTYLVAGCLQGLGELGMTGMGGMVPLWFHIPPAETAQTENGTPSPQEEPIFYDWVRFPDG